MFDTHGELFRKSPFDAENGMSIPLINILEREKRATGRGKKERKKRNFFPFLFGANPFRRRFYLAIILNRYIRAVISVSDIAASLKKKQQRHR